MGLMTKGTGHCVRSEVWERWLVGVEFLGGTCCSERSGGGGSCCVETWVVTQSS